METDKTKAISRIMRGVHVIDIHAQDLFIAYKICFAFIIHPVHVEVYKGMGGTLRVGKGG